MQKRRITCLILAALLCSLSCAASGEADSESYIMAGYDNTQSCDWLNNRFFVRMEERTGIHFVLQQSTSADAWNRIISSLNADSQEMPDVLFKAALTTQDCIRLRQEGVLIDLKPYLRENCPNLWALMEEDPGILSAITLPDGSVAALPYISPIPPQNYMWINQKWLDTLHLAMPTSLDELETVLTAFRDRDPNRNGKKDEIPLSFLGPFDLKFLAHAFGLIANDYNIYAENGQVRFMPLEENYRPFVTWCRDMFNKKLLYHERWNINGFYITDNQRMVNDSKAAATCGMILTNSPAALFSVSWSTDYVLLEPFAFEGKQIYRDFSGPVVSGTFAITSACKDPAKMLRWVDYLYSREGSNLAVWGQENVDYMVDGDGSWRLLESQQSDYYRASVSVDGNGEARIPCLVDVEFQCRYSGDTAVRDILQSQLRYNQFLKRPFPDYALTQEQMNAIAPLQARIGEYVDLQLARWVLGEEEISDESFARFDSTLQDMGLKEFMAFWQSVLDRQ